MVQKIFTALIRSMGFRCVVPNSSNASLIVLELVESPEQHREPYDKLNELLGMKVDCMKFSFDKERVEHSHRLVFSA